MRVILIESLLYELQEIAFPLVQPSARNDSVHAGQACCLKKAANNSTHVTPLMKMTRTRQSTNNFSSTPNSQIRELLSLRRMERQPAS